MSTTLSPSLLLERISRHQCREREPRQRPACGYDREDGAGADPRRLPCLRGHPQCCYRLLSLCRNETPAWAGVVIFPEKPEVWVLVIFFFFFLMIEIKFTKIVVQSISV